MVKNTTTKNPKSTEVNNSDIDLITIINHVGTTDFDQKVLEYLTRQVSVDIEWIVRYSPFLKPSLLHKKKYEHANPRIDLDMVDKLYNDGYYRFDPWYRYWREDGRGGVLNPNKLGRLGESREDYFSALKPFLGNMCVIAIFFPVLGRSAITIFLEREVKFTGEENEFIERSFPVLLALHRLHEQIVLNSIRSTRSDNTEENIYMLLDESSRCLYASEGWKTFVEKDPDLSKITTTFASGPAPDSIKTVYGILHFEKTITTPLWGKSSRIVYLERGLHAKSSCDINDALNEFQTNELTPREKQLIQLIILGFTNEKIAEELHIGVGTVRNHRKRLYQKLEITSERELFTKFLNFLEEKFM